MEVLKAEGAPRRGGKEGEGGEGCCDSSQPS